MTNEKPTPDDLLLMTMAQVREKLTVPLSDDAVIFIALGVATLLGLIQKYALPYEEEKLWHSYFDQLEVEFQHLEEAKRAIEKGGHTGHEVLDGYIQTFLSLRLYPERWDNLEQMASFVLVLTAFTKWDTPIQLDNTSGNAFITDFYNRYNEKVTSFFIAVV